MKKFFQKIKDGLKRKKGPADAEAEIKEILSEGQADQEDQAEQFHAEDRIEEEITLGDTTSPGITTPQFNVEDEITKDEVTEDIEEEEEDAPPLEIKEMKLGDVSQELTSEDDNPPLPDDVPPVPGERHEGTQEIRIDPQQLQMLRENDDELNKLLGEGTAAENNEEDTGPTSFKTMKLPKNFAQTGIRQWPKALGKKFAPFVEMARQRFARWQQERVAQGRPELSWDRLFDDLFSTDNRAAIHRVFLGAVIATSAYGMGKLTAFLIKGAEERIKPASTSAAAARPIQYPIGAIKTANLFNSVLEKGADGLKGPQKDKDHSKKVCKDASKGSSLPLELTNTIVLQDSVKSVASVAVRGEKQILNVREGDNIQAMAQVGKINRLNLVIKNLSSGECEYIENKELQKQDRPINVVGEKQGRKMMEQFSNNDIQNEGNKFKIKKQFRDKMLENVGEVLSQARAVQMKNPDGSLAFKMTEVVPGSIYSKLNIKDEDIITKINGKEISSLNDIMSMFGSIKSIDQLSITVMRDGVEVEMDYRFE